MPHGDGHGHGQRTNEVPEPGGLLFIDASISGVAGDMLCAGLIDLGVPLEAMREGLAGLDLGAYRIDTPTVERSGIVARRFIVTVEGQQPQRSWAAIRTLIENAKTLSDGARERALSAFLRLAHAEADVHGMAVDDVHFHEVGAVDSIVDIVAASIGLDQLNATVVVSPLPMGRGTVKAQHGMLPLPAPATVSCLQGAPVFDGGIDAELVTPTGATLVATAASRWERWPAMRPLRTGWGAGTRDLPDRPNLVRLVFGQPAGTVDSLVVLEANIDDMTPEIGAHVIDALFEAGARDAWLSPITMKKGRLGVMVGALCDEGHRTPVMNALLSESSSIGVRIRPVQRFARPRRFVEVSTRFGLIPVKIADGDGLPRNVAPELEACRKAAKEHGVPLKEVFAAAITALEAVP